MLSTVILILFYTISFLSNYLKFALKTFGKKEKDKKCLFPKTKLFFAGLTLFILCDLNVLIFNLYMFININSAFYNNLNSLASIMIWGFYLPSQVIIVLSAILTRS